MLLSWCFIFPCAETAGPAPPATRSPRGGGALSNRRRAASPPCRCRRATGTGWAAASGQRPPTAAPPQRPSRREPLRWSSAPCRLGGGGVEGGALREPRNGPGFGGAGGGERRAPPPQQRHVTRAARCPSPLPPAPRRGSPRTGSERAGRRRGCAQRRRFRLGGGRARGSGEAAAIRQRVPP